MIGLLLGFAAGGWLAQQGPWQPWQNAAAQAVAVSSAPPREPLRAAPSPSDLTPDELRNIQVYETANRSVVNINTTMIEVDRFFMLQREAEGSGSGAVLDKQGHIITNYHVIDAGDSIAQKIEVTLASNQTYPATFV
ncbi:MAG: hypothetical protein DCC67_16885, partial [Planctomycetota bacterium]